MYKDELILAKRAVLTSAKYLEGLTDLSVDSLQGKDIKLEADRKSESLLIETLAESGIPVLAEESGALGEQDGLRWIIDPIDGTYNFFRGARDLSCISVALWDGMKPLTGTLYRLGAQQLFQGDVAAGKAFVNGIPIQTTGIVQPAEAALATGFPVYMDYSTDNLQKYILAAQQFKKIRMFGAAALMSTFVGVGYVDVYSEKSIKLWDVAAGVAITLAAGGAVRMDDMGNNKCHIALCANAELLENVTPILF